MDGGKKMQLKLTWAAPGSLRNEVLAGDKPQTTIILLQGKAGFRPLPPSFQPESRDLRFEHRVKPRSVHPHRLREFLPNLVPRHRLFTLRGEDPQNRVAQVVFPSFFFFAFRFGSVGWIGSHGAADGCRYFSPLRRIEGVEVALVVWP